MRVDLKKLTDRKVAKIFGWRPGKGPSESWRGPRGEYEEGNCPAFTSDLNLLARECRLRGLKWMVDCADDPLDSSRSGKYQAGVEARDGFIYEGNGYWSDLCDTPAEALCQAITACITGGLK